MLRFYENICELHKKLEFPNFLSQLFYNDNYCNDIVYNIERFLLEYSCSN